MELFLIFIGAVLVNNFVLTRFLGICPFLGQSQNMKLAFGMGMSVIFVMTLTSITTNLIHTYILVPLELKYLVTVSFILVIASLVQLVDIVLQKLMPMLHQSMGIYLVLITTNCAILGLALLNVVKEYNFAKSLVFGFSAGVGFTLALIIIAGIRERLELADIPKPLRGFPITLIIAGLLSIAFMGFTGLVKM
ncbi:electron transport complex subunit RsxA [Candidatus Poribacteria bacterium]|nr:electron transport complex subunit RsxA [Candidatus Poribacteria bacterium]